MLHRRRFLLGAVVTTGFLILLFLQVDLSEMGSSLAEANYVYLAPGVAIYFVSVYFRAYRWRFLLHPIRAVSALRLYPVVAVGYMANNLLPVRLGELARSYYLARREPVPASTALATIMVERIFDGIVLLFFLAVAALFLPVAGLADRVSDAVRMPVALVAVAVIVPFIAALTAMVGAALYPMQARRLSSALTRLLLGVIVLFVNPLTVMLGMTLYASRSRHRVLRLLEGIGPRIDSLVDLFIEGFSVLRGPRPLATVFILSLPIWLAEGTMYYVIALGFDLDSHFETVGLMAASMLLLTSVSNLAASLPSSQGSVGPFEFFGVLTLVFLGVTSGLATAYVVVLHLALLLPVVVLGLTYLALDHLSLGNLTRDGRVEAAMPSASVTKEQPREWASLEAEPPAWAPPMS